MKLVCVLLALLCVARPASAQQTRAEEWEARRAGSKAVVSRDHSRLENILQWIQDKNILERLQTPGAGYKGFRPKLGGLSTGSGFGFGVQFDRPGMFGDAADLSFSASASPRQYQLYQAKLDFPRLANERAFFSVEGRYRAMPEEDFYGAGPDSEKADRSDYLYEDRTIGATAGASLTPTIRVGGNIRQIVSHVGRGRDARFVNVEERFTPSEVPGFGQATDHVETALFAEWDRRDSKGNPHRGTYLAVRESFFNDYQIERFDFRRFDAEAQAYIPFNNGHRVVALRASTTLDDAAEGNTVPFYMQKTLGGSEDLRGFREFRFRDNNQMVFNAEYRWEAWIGLDMALFADAGKVFHSTRDFNLKNLESDYGIGFRFNTSKGVFLRMDIARSNEGTRFFMKFNHVF